MVKAPRFSVWAEGLGLLRAVVARRPDHSPDAARVAVPVFVIPGLNTTDRWTAALRRDLASRGHPVRGWGLGRNTGQMRVQIPLVADELVRWTDTHGPTAVVGWSLGGTIARELGRAHPARVRRVVTLGTPAQGGPKYTATAGWYLRRGADLDQMEASIAASNIANPLTVPLTVIYSRTDRVVAWQASLDPWHDADQVEVETSHIGLVVHPAALEAVAAAVVSEPGARR